LGVHTAESISVASNHAVWFAPSSCLKMKSLLILHHEQTGIPVFTHSWIRSERIYSQTPDVGQNKIFNKSIIQASFKVYLPLS